MASRRDLSRWGLVVLALALACGDDAPAPEEAPLAPVAAPSSIDAPLAPVARLSTADRWIDLIAQRPSAVTTAGDRTLIELGRPAAQIHAAMVAGETWRFGQEIEGRRAGVVLGRGAALELPVDGPLAPLFLQARPEGERAGAGEASLGMAITLRALAKDQLVTVLWNETPLANLSVREDWERRTFSLPPGLVRAGENRLRLHFRRTAAYGELGEVSAAVATVELGRIEDIRAGPPPPADPYRVDPVRDGAELLTLPAGRGLAFYVLAPNRGKLRIEARGRGRLQALVSTEADHREGRPPAVLLDEPVAPSWRERELDLAGHGGVPIRVELRADGREPDAEVSLRALEIVVRRAVPVDRRERVLRDLYVVAVEAARADEVFVSDARAARLPALDRIARESLVFTRAYAVEPWSVPTQMAALSSVIPPVHRTVRGVRLASGQTLLSELLDQAGFHTVAVTANGDFTAERGLDQGFDRLVSLDRSSAQGDAASDLVAAGLAALAEAPPRASPPPRLLYLNIVDPRAPYDPPRPLAERVERPAAKPGEKDSNDLPAPHLTHLWVGKVHAGKHEPSARELAYVRALYRGELQSVDQAVDELLAALEADGRLEDAALVFVGLHGEEFHEHGRAGHGFSLYEEAIRVPLAIRAPKLLAPGRVTAPVDLVDLAPTLADLLGLQVPASWQGASLVPIIDDPQPPPRLVVSYLGDGSRAAIVGDYKLIVGPVGGRAGWEQLFDLARDPRETVNLAERGGVALRIVRTALLWQQQAEGRWKRARWGDGANLAAAFALDHGM